MKITNPVFWKAAGLLGTALIRNWMGLIDFKAAFYDPELDPAFLHEKQRYIALFWHEYILCPLYLRRNTNVTMMLSRHNDAEIVGRIAKLSGLRCIRGSSFRGGAAAVKQFLEMPESLRNIIAITPDGPRGPRRRLSVGPIFLASKLRIPVVLLGVGYDRPWRTRSWDRFAIPRPFSRGRFILSSQFPVPADLDKDGLELFRQRFETQLTYLTEEAENWAASGEPLLGESLICSGPKCSLTYYGYSRPAVINEERRVDN
ncbi:MAG: lysophospholipid acyltransferase family protein [Planctomycetaceae bacterium]|nr:lysophospholipid acyltransferase family protein [Planctomycetaceae bacterium]